MGGLRIHAPAIGGRSPGAGAAGAGRRGVDAAAIPGSAGALSARVFGRAAPAHCDCSGADRAAKLLVLDEPTSALDVTIQKQILHLLQALQRERGLSYLLITHDVDVIRAMAHEVLVMKDGAVVESGAIERVLDAPQHEYTRVLVAAAA